MTQPSSLLRCASQGGADGDTIVVYPSRIDPHCEALFFILSASDSEVCTMNLSNPDSLQFNGYSAGTDLKMLVYWSASLLQRVIHISNRVQISVQVSNHIVYRDSKVACLSGYCSVKGKLPSQNLSASACPVSKTLPEARRKHR